MEIRLQRCSWRAQNEEANKHLDDDELKTWSQLRKLGLVESAGIFRGLVSSALYERRALRELDLSGNTELRCAEFGACAQLSTITTLSLRSTSITCAEASRILSRPSLLRELDVSQCSAITPALCAALPPTLAVLRARKTRLLTGADGNGMTGGYDGVSDTLRVLNADYSSLQNWRALSSGVSELRELYLAYSKFLGDERVEEALAAMPQLEKLNLQGCCCVGNRTAAAIVRHSKLSHSWVHRTHGCR